MTGRELAESGVLVSLPEAESSELVHLRRE